MAARQHLHGSDTTFYYGHYDSNVYESLLFNQCFNGVAMCTVEMPKYKCHKEVWALKIKSIVRDGEGENRESDGSFLITPEEKGYAPFKVDLEYIHKHNPKAGGYFVQYEDGYKSFSPAEAFESGYKRI